MSSWINTNFSIDAKYLWRHKIYCHVLIAFKKWKIANDNTEYLLIYHKVLHLAYLKIFNVCFLSRFRFRFLLMVVVDLISSSSLPNTVLFLGYIKCTRLIYTIGINCSNLKFFLYHNHTYSAILYFNKAIIINCLMWYSIFLNRVKYWDKIEMMTFDLVKFYPL